MKNMFGRDIWDVFRRDHINFFIQVAMEEGIIDTKLKNGVRGSRIYNKEDPSCNHLSY